MPQQPEIIVQLIHIQGPLKGQIQEFSDPEIWIGRHPSCHVQFPRDMTTISRHHAKIIRDGNRFKLVDQSANGTFIKGKPVKETYLTSGDVLILAEENGPRISFLTETRSEAEIPTPRHPSPPTSPPPASRNAAEDRTFEVGEDRISQEPPPPPPAASPSLAVEKVKVPLAIQYGPTLKAFRELPITVGRHPDCDFVLDHPDVSDRHLQIFFSEDRYGIKDLTGKQLVQVNGGLFQDHALLNPNDRIQLAPGGPGFQFLAGGRLAEIEAPGVGDDAPAPPASTAAEENKERSIIDKLFKR
jgi:pSer/pThr/pTyr-binding forkhead associated (FHA) protein